MNELDLSYYCLDSSLDRHGQNSTKLENAESGQTERREWTRKQKRAYHRILSLLTYWASHDYQILWITLTSSPASDYEQLTYHHKLLKQRVERELGYRDIQHFWIRTTEGYGVLHLFWAWKPANGERKRRFYIPNNKPEYWFGRLWENIHGAMNVWIAKVKNSRKSIKRLSKYVVSQYCASHEFDRMSWSWKRSLGFPLGKAWEFFKDNFLNVLERKFFIKKWTELMTGKEVIIGNYFITIQKLRECYQQAKKILLGYFIFKQLALDLE